MILGEANTRRAMYLAVGLAVACGLAAIIRQVFPLWVGLVLLFSVAISMLFRPTTDMRGGKATDTSGSFQIQGLVAANLTIGIWFAEVLFSQIFLR
jgi:1,4-dihydroxy-2-naphthoate octaprenyltransferase